MARVSDPGTIAELTSQRGYEAEVSTAGQDSRESFRTWFFGVERRREPNPRSGRIHRHARECGRLERHHLCGWRGAWTSLTRIV